MTKTAGVNRTNPAKRNANFLINLPDQHCFHSNKNNVTHIFSLLTFFTALFLKNKYFLIL